MFDNTFLKIKRNKNIPCLTKSEAAAQTLKDKGFLDVTPVGVGLDMENLEPVSTEDGKINSTERPYRLLYVGKLEERRNLFFLLEVFRKLLKKNSVQMVALHTSVNVNAVKTAILTIFVTAEMVIA